MALFHLFSFYYLSLDLILFCVLSLSHSFGKNSSWIVFLEEETNVKMTKLVQVLAKFDKNKVSIYNTSISLSLFVFITLSLFFKLSCSSRHLSSIVPVGSSTSGATLISASSQCNASDSSHCRGLNIRLVGCKYYISITVRKAYIGVEMKRFFLNQA